MQSEWDKDKSAANIAKHGVSFATAARIFDGSVFTVLDDRRDYGEVGKNSIGQVDGILYLVVTHTDRDERIRIISARPAKRSERQRHDETL